jgi:hypothetical protein
MVGSLTAYGRADLNDLVMLIQLKLPLPDSRPESTAQLFNAVEDEIKSWATAKPILAARRLGADGTRGISMCDVVSLHRHLVDSGDELFMREPSRDATIVARANHTLGNDHGRWNSILAAD